MNPKPFQLVLDQAQTAAIRESGVHFMAGSPVTINTATGRATLLLFECDRKTADAACGVVMGTHRAILRRSKP